MSSLGALPLTCGRPRLARTIPNAPSAIGAGYKPVYFGYAPGGSFEQRSRILETRIVEVS